MKTQLAFAIVMTALAGTIQAADQQKPLEGDRYPTRSTEHSNRFDRLGPVEKASDVIGTEVRNYQNEKLGKVDELAVDLESGRIVNVIVSTGGFLGVGDTLVAVPPGALHGDKPNRVIHLDADKAKLKGAPKFDATKWDECCDSNRVSEVYRYYGQEPNFTGTREVRSTPTADRLNPTDRARDPARIDNRDSIAHSGESMRWDGRMGYIAKASKIMGLPVKNLAHEKLGKVENLMVDLGSGRIVMVILSSGGFLGLGNELSGVPPGALKYDADRSSLVLDVTKESLGRAPHFRNEQWPDWGQPVYTEGVYRAYRMEPYFSTNRTESDKTKANVRDRGSRALTPLDQGNGEGDVDMTSRIRKELLAQTGLSVNARNVKVITVNGRVTLRGEVNTTAEKTRVAEIARRLATDGNVDDQLEVKPSDQ